MSYTGKDIRNLGDIEAIRLRPGMYIGATDVNGLHHLPVEIVNNSMDEALNGFGNHIIIKVINDTTMVVIDSGRGLPFGLNEDEDNALVVAATASHAGGKFDENAYKTAGGLHGVGLTVTNALSTSLEITSIRDGKRCIGKFKRGELVDLKEEKFKSKTTGTTIKFTPDQDIFGSSCFEYERVSSYLKELSYFNPGLKFTLIFNDRKPEVFLSKKGIIELIEPIPNELTPARAFRYEGDRYKLDVAFKFVKEGSENIKSYVNMINTDQGGTHVTGARSALTTAVNKMAKQYDFLGKDKPNFRGELIRKGLVMILSLTMNGTPAFKNQTKNALMTPEARGWVSTAFGEHLPKLLGKKDIEKIVEKIQLETKLENAAKRARQAEKEIIQGQKNAKMITSLPAKLLDAEGDYQELFLVEGDSAGGTLKSVRELYQAVLPLRGKVLNTHSLELADIIKNDEVKAIMNTFGCGAGTKTDVKKLRYDKIVFAMDADDDGYHIVLLLLTLLLYHMRPVLESGAIYQAITPLYGIPKGKEMVYIYSEKELQEYEEKYGLPSHYDRYKGLGALTADQIEMCLVNDATRKLVQLKVEDVEETLRLFDIMMGKNSSSRKMLLTTGGRGFNDLLVLIKQSISGFVKYARAANERSSLAVQDGLKPVHRRILYGMSGKKNKAIKSARVVGDVMGLYHPHGDLAVYDAMIRMSQDFKLRYPLVHIVGNGGSILEPKSNAASRYTSAKLTPLGQLLLEGLKDDAVQMVENYSGDVMEPSVLPSIVPNILLNGGKGIGVAQACNLLPHNFIEVSNTIKAYLNNENIKVEELLAHIKGPDFPTGGIITNANRIEEFYKNGKGTFKVRGKYHIETIAKRDHIVITEVPYLISIEDKIINPIKNLVTEEVTDEIHDIKNNSGKNGLEIRVILEKKANVNRVLKLLFEHTGLETNISMNNSFMINNKPKVLNLLGIIKMYIEHRHGAIIRVARKKKLDAERKLHIQKGIKVALDMIDETVKTIRSSKDTSSANAALRKLLSIDEVQAKAILDMKLSKLTNLEINKIIELIKELKENIKEFSNIIEKKSKRVIIIKEQLKDSEKLFKNDKRRTVLDYGSLDDMMSNEDVFVIQRKDGYISAALPSEMPEGSRTSSGSKINDDIINVFPSNTNRAAIALNAVGKMWPIQLSLLDVGIDNTNHIGSVCDFTGEVALVESIDVDKEYFISVTKNGRIKKTKIEDYKNFKKALIALKVKTGEELLAVMTLDNEDNVILLGTDSKITKVKVSDIKSTGRATQGALYSKGIELISATGGSDEDEIIVLAEGKCKRTVIGPLSKSNKSAATCIVPVRGDNIFGIASGKGVMFPKDSVAVRSKEAQGVQIMKKKVERVFGI